MEENTNEKPNENAGTDRREAIQKLGRFAMYAAPFTVLALSAKGATGSSGAPHVAPRH